MLGAVPGAAGDQSPFLQTYDLFGGGGGGRCVDTPGSGVDARLPKACGNASGRPSPCAKLQAGALLSGFISFPPEIILLRLSLDQRAEFLKGETNGELGS